jgi:hypothetical protein
MVVSISSMGRSAAVTRLLEPGGGDRAGPQAWVRDDGGEQLAVGVHALHHEGRERVAHGVQGAVAVGAVRDELGHQRVVVGRDERAVAAVGVDPQPGQGGGGEAGHASRARREVALGILGHQPALDGVPGEGDLLLGEGEALAVGDAQLEGDEVQAAHRLGDRVLHLDAAVALQEVEAGRLGVDHELDGSQVAVADRGGERHARLEQSVAQRGRQRGRRGLLGQLLVATLGGAVALAEMDDRAVVVGGDLHLEVARRHDQTLDVEALIAEGSPRLGARQRVAETQLVEVARKLDAAPAPAAGRLEQERKAVLGRERLGLFEGGDLAARDDRDAGGDGGRARLQLVPGGGDHLRGRPHEAQPVLTGRGGERRALGEEAVAGVDGVASGPAGRLDHRVDPQVAVGGAGRAEDHGAVGQLGGHRVAIDGRDADHGLDPQLAARAHDAHRDLATVGDEQPPGPHPRWLPSGATRKSGWPNSTSSPLAASTSTMVPATPAWMWFISFITSIRQTTVSASTRSPISTKGACVGDSVR